MAPAVEPAQDRGDRKEDEQTNCDLTNESQRRAKERDLTDLVGDIRNRVDRARAGLVAGQLRELFRGLRTDIGQTITGAAAAWIEQPYDPAPAGKFQAPMAEPLNRPARIATAATSPTAPMEAGRLVDVDRLVPNESCPVWNRMSLREDHGTYWDNEEQFIVPLLREIDTSSDQSPSSRFFRDPARRDVATRRRIERVAALGWWRILTGAAAVLAIGSAAPEVDPAKLWILGEWTGQEAISGRQPIPS